jgi:hypothetical protein
MDYSKILKRAFEITRKYRALWLFGILFALFGGGGGGNFNFNFPSGGDRGTGDFVPPSLRQITQEMILVIVGVVACVAIIWILLSIILRFVSRGALIGLVRELETNQTTPTVRRGFDIGFSRFWSLLGIGLIVNIPLFIVSVGIVLMAIVPLIASIVPLASLGSGRAPSELIALGIFGIIGSTALLCCVALFLMLIGLVIHPFYEFFVRECVIRKRGAMDSIREGYRIVRAKLKDVAVLYIILIGIGIGFGIVMIPVTLVLIGIPVGAAVLVGIVANSITPAIVVGLVIGIPMLLVLLYISGLYRTFESTVWTEGYLTITAPKGATGA